LLALPGGGLSPFADGKSVLGADWRRCVQTLYSTRRAREHTRQRFNRHEPKVLAAFIRAIDRSTFSRSLAISASSSATRFSLTLAAWRCRFLRCAAYASRFMRADSPSKAIALEGPQNATLVPARAIALGLCAPADVAKHPVLKLWGLRAITAPAAVLVQVRV
jgi:hypothetical protein